MTQQQLSDRHPVAHWQSALAEGRLLLQRSRKSGRAFFPPRVAEPGTGDTDYEWVEATGEGTVYSVTVISRKPPEEPYNVVLVDLDEGPRLMSRVEGIAAEQVRIGMRVRARVRVEDADHILLFDPA